MPGTDTITEGQVAQYRRDGAILLKAVLSADQLALLERGVEESLARPGECFTQVQGREGKGETYTEFLPSLQCPSLRELNATGPISAIAGQLMQVPAAHFLFDQVFYKKRGTILPTPWHQDTPFYNVRGQDIARVWMSCDPSPRELTVQVVRGSHLWNVLFDLMPAGVSATQIVEEGKGFTYAGLVPPSNAPRVPDVAGNRDSFDVLSWEVEPGDLLVFQGNILHGADGMDHYPLDRRVYTSVWGGPELRRCASGGTGTPTYADTTGIRVPDGARLGDYELAYPVGWRSA